MKKILITTARSPLVIDLVRQLNAAGHRVFVADTLRWHVCRPSKCVEKSYIVPSPRFEPDAYVEKLADISKAEKIDLLIPTWEEIFCISKRHSLFPKTCEVFCSSFDVLHHLHNKWLFYQKQLQHGIPAPTTALVEREEDLNNLPFNYAPYALKPCYSRACQNVSKVFPTEPKPTVTFKSYNPWVAQEWLYGKKFCTYSVCKNGKLLAHTTYPVQYALDDSSCFTFQHVEHPAIEAWVKSFVGLENFTGQIAFDFIETLSGQLFAIECNPRSTHGLILFNGTDRLDKAFFETPEKLIIPHPEVKKQIAFGMLLYGWRIARQSKDWRGFLKRFFTYKDIVYDRKDIKPFLMMPFLVLQHIKTALTKRIPLPAAYYHDIDWDGEVEPQPDTD